MEGREKGKMEGRQEGGERKEGSKEGRRGNIQFLMAEMFPIRIRNTNTYIQESRKSPL